MGAKKHPRSPRAASSTRPAKPFTKAAVAADATDELLLSFSSRVPPRLLLGVAPSAGQLATWECHAIEFRSLLMNQVKRVFPYRSAWSKRNRLPLCQLLLQYHDTVHIQQHAEADAMLQPAKHAFDAALLSFVESLKGRNLSWVDKLESDEKIEVGSSGSSSSSRILADARSREDGSASPSPVQTPASSSIDDPAEAGNPALDAHRRALATAALRGWIQQCSTNVDVQAILALLRQALALEPDPLVQRQSDGAMGEGLVASLLSSCLPAGWSALMSLVVTEVNGRLVESRRFQKGEVDIAVVNAQGVVQAVIEIKTSYHTPPISSCAEDTHKLRSLMELIRGKRVTFRPLMGAGPTRALGPPVTLLVPAQAKALYVLAAVPDAEEDAAPATDPVSSSCGDSPSIAASAASGMAAASGSGRTALTGERAAVGRDWVDPSTAGAQEDSVLCGIDLAVKRLLRSSISMALSTKPSAWRHVQLEALDNKTAVLKVGQELRCNAEKDTLARFKLLSRFPLYVVRPDAVSVASAAVASQRRQATLPR